MKKILSIDGGGIKGIYAASFLAQMEKKCGINIYEYFDLIAGASTGGIIAGALALGISAQRILDLYVQKGGEIFPKHRLRHLFKTKYSSGPLESEFGIVFQELCLKDCKTRLVIPAYNLASRKVRVFKTPHADDLFFDKDIRMTDCLLATTAAPTYFRPHKMEGGVFIDGGVGANNPSLIAMVEGITRCDWPISDIFLLSIGDVSEQGMTTGDEKMGMLNVQKILDCFMTAETQYAENICNLMLPPGHYIRVSQRVPPRQVSLDQVSMRNMKKLENWGFESAKEYMREIQKIFLKDKIEKVKFFNLESGKCDI